MFCEKCGNQLPDNSAFCDSCGAKQLQPQQAQQPQYAPAPAAQVQNGFVEFNGKHFPIADIADVDTANGTSGVTYCGLLVVGGYKSYIRLSFKSGAPDEIIGSEGKSVLGIGSKHSAKKWYEQTCAELAAQVGQAMVMEKAAKIRSGEPIKIAAFPIEKHARNWAIRSDGIIYYRFFKEKLIPKEDFDRCVVKGGLVHIYSKSGKHLKQVVTNDDFLNLILSDVILTLYR
ncbi:MAG: zinc ribbon domain-containing protein [Oscillospiraceae bacterium]|jgi:hypothetical protein|nr:zinc ribbon domain-containing protein [Oscillospiraceae bacterium]